MLKRLLKLGGEIVLKNPWWEYRKDRYTLPSGREGEYHYVHTPGSVFVVARQSDGKFIMVRQYRYLNQRESLEFIGGGVKADQAIEEAARAELAEEAGLSANKLVKIGEFNPYNGVTDELCTVFLATELEEAHAVSDEGEEFTVERYSAAEIRKMIAGGEIWDGMTLAAFGLYEQYEGK
jgi:ADP-ribose pyrophosphatase